MTTDLSSKSALIWDHGLFFPLATRLARDFGEVKYFVPWQRGFPSYHEHDIGRGFDDVERVQSFWEAMPRADLIVFPDVLDGDLQVYLREQGKCVWGSGMGEELELFRHFGKKMFDACGLPVQPYKSVKGIDALREHLQKHEDKFIKVSLLRGITETFHHDKFWMTEARLDELEHTLGIRKHTTDFLIEDPIETNLEYGFDGTCIDGKFPGIAGNGVERKDEALVMIVQNYDDLPEGTRQVNEALAPYLEKVQYRNFWSTEIRQAKDGTPYLIDPTCRSPSPSGEAQHELWTNLSEMIWHGANGELVDPVPAAKYAVEAIIYGDRADDNWQPIEFPEAIRKNVKLFFHTRVNGHDFVIPQATKMNEIGAVVAIGDDLEKTAEDCRRMAKLIKGDKVEVRVKAIDDCIAEFKEMEQKGISLTPFSGCFCPATSPAFGDYS